MIRRVFWGWDQPLLSRAVASLTQGWRGGELDLSQTLLIVPTTESARRLKEGLARATAAKQGAAVVPHVWAPEQVLMAPEDRELAAPWLASLFAWAKVLQGVDFAECTRLFPHPPEKADESWCLATAQMLLDLGSTLGAGGWNFSKMAASDHARSDVERWRELAALERRYHQLIEAQGLRDPQTLKAARAGTPWLPEGIDRVFVLAAPDLPPLLTTWIHMAAKCCDVTICVQAPTSLAHGFDDEGRPEPGYWQSPSALPEPVPIGGIHLAPNAAAQAHALIELVADLAQRKRTALGVCDPEVTAALKERLSLENVRVFEPGGVPPQSQGLWHIFSCWRDLLMTRSWRSVAALLRVREVASAWLDVPDEGGTARLLRAADSHAAVHMPVTLEHAMELLAPGEDAGLQSLQTALSTAVRWIDLFERLPLDEAIRGLLIQLYGERPFTPSAPADRLHLELAEAVLDAGAEVQAESGRFAFKTGTAESFALALDRVGKTMLTEPRGEVDMVLQGWLELLWEEAPCVAVAGVNEEHVPGILVSHPFLPDSLRQEMRLPSQASRYARDAYLLHAMAAQRQQGDLQLLCGQWSERGDALRPSRLLFRGSDLGLPDRIAHLFPKDDLHTTAPEPPSCVAWKLQPRFSKVELKTVSASRLNAYLTCPFRFYLSSVLRMEPVDPSKREMAANEFGSLIHGAFQKLGRDKAMAECTQEKEIADFLCAVAEAQASDLYGRNLPVLVRLQLESALQRLRAAAACEAVERANGWRIHDTEVRLEGELKIGGVPFTGMIDRIEKRERGGRLEVRLIDFKSSDKAQSPQVAHARELKAQSKWRAEDEWQLFDGPDGGQFQWQNLQLPLYAAALASKGMTDVQVAYFNLPKNVQETNLSLWDGFNKAWIDAALACAETAVERILEGRFWPPARVKYDDYSELFLGDVMSAVEFSGSEPPPGVPSEPSAV